VRSKDGLKPSRAVESGTSSFEGSVRVRGKVEDDYTFATEIDLSKDLLRCEWHLSVFPSDRLVACAGVSSEVRSVRPVPSLVCLCRLHDG
jgi:hypothetical protein